MGWERGGDDGETARRRVVDATLNGREGGNHFRVVGAREKHCLVGGDGVGQRDGHIWVNDGTMGSDAFHVTHGLNAFQLRAGQSRGSRGDLREPGWGKEGRFLPKELYRSRIIQKDRKKRKEKKKKPIIGCLTWVARNPTSRQTGAPLVS